ncbi:serine-threonine protein kinase [Streptomyces sp. CRN 30]|uniref:serine-threonine protein kinase n=1 Tax=Streptomyces sp. CRN 30 TaxID=3075613 RepID=UPI002A812FB8|nr:serine-threonine protein kinase [Streptomyces sp. CRN 30]
MAGASTSVFPYWELSFDADGDPDGRRRDRLLAGAAGRGVRDLLVFAHGWNNDRALATRLCGRFFAPVPGLVPNARVGYVCLLWPSMRFADEPVPDLPLSTTGGPVRPPALDKDTRHALQEVFPGRDVMVEQVARMLEARSPEEGELEEFRWVVRLLVELVPPGPQALFAADTVGPGGSAGEPRMFTAPAAEVCAEFARAVAAHGPPPGELRGLSLPDPWEGARELLRQATYYAMKRRAGTVGERGLGPLLGRLAQAAPGVRVHLVGHSFGARLVSFALRGLPEGVRTVKSVTLLQGAFSHYAFADRLPHDPRAEGVLRGRQHRVDGPLVCSHSRYDASLGTFYPLASRLAGDDRAAAPAGAGRGSGDRWGALGYDGVRAVPGTRACTLTEAVRGGLPHSGCVNVDAAAVVRRGGPPGGAHSDVLHAELARLVLAAGRVR